MTLARIRRWVATLPPYEVDKPIIVLNGVAYTPRAILEEVERGTAVGEQLQRMVESQVAALHQEELEQLALLRLRLHFSQPSTVKFVTLTYPPKVLTREDVLREVEAGTPTGRQFVEAEKQIIRMMLARAR
jgi:hypothetical protein